MRFALQLSLSVVFLIAFLPPTLRADEGDETVEVRDCGGQSILTKYSNLHEGQCKEWQIEWRGPSGAAWGTCSAKTRDKVVASRDSTIAFEKRCARFFERPFDEKFSNPSEPICNVCDPNSPAPDRVQRLRSRLLRAIPASEQDSADLLSGVLNAMEVARNGQTPKSKIWVKTLLRFMAKAKESFNNLLAIDRERESRAADPERLLKELEKIRSAAEREFRMLDKDLRDVLPHRYLFRPPQMMPDWVDDLYDPETRVEFYDPDTMVVETRRPDQEPPVIDRSEIFLSSLDPGSVAVEERSSAVSEATYEAQNLDVDPHSCTGRCDTVIVVSEKLGIRRPYAWDVVFTTPNRENCGIRDLQMNIADTVIVKDGECRTRGRLRFGSEAKAKAVAETLRAMVLKQQAVKEVPAH